MCWLTMVPSWEAGRQAYPSVQSVPSGPVQGSWGQRAVGTPTNHEEVAPTQPDSTLTGEEATKPAELLQSAFENTAAIVSRSLLVIGCSIGFQGNEASLIQQGRGGRETNQGSA